jgi:hypothetical protein
MRTKKMRYKLFNGETLIGEATSIEGVGELVGCTKQHIFQQLTQEGTFKFLRVTYTIIDKLNS